jgi:hypothetical protein
MRHCYSYRHQSLRRPNRLTSLLLTGRSLPPLAKTPFIRFQVVFQQVLAPIHGLHFEIIGPRPIRQVLDLVPPVDHCLDLNDALSPDKTARRLVSLGSGVAFDLDRNERHTREEMLLTNNLPSCWIGSTANESATSGGHSRGSARRQGNLRAHRVRGADEAPGHRKLEHHWADLLESAPRFRVPIARFGSSDYHRSRASHLFYARRRPSFRWFERQLRDAFEKVRAERYLIPAPPGEC